MKKIFIVITQVIMITFEIYAQGNYLELLTTDKSRYNPGDTVNFELDINNQPVNSYILVKYKHLLQTIGTDSIPYSNSNQISWYWNPPEKDFAGYLTEVFLLDEDSLLGQINTAVDVSSDWAKYPRYGFLSKYPEMTEEEMEAVISNLNRYHINGLQFYDWQYKHHKPLKGTPQNPAPFWQDVANRTNYFSTVSGYIDIAHNYNMKAMSYNLLYGALDSAEADGVLEEWFLYKDQYHTMRDSLDLSFWGHYIYLLDPSNEDWKNYIFQNTQDAFTALNFDGWQVDQVGERGIVYNYAGENVILQDAFSEYLSDAKNYLTVELVMNAVNQYGQPGIAQSPVEFLYTEVWSPNISFGNLTTIIWNNLTMSGGSLRSVLAAYVNHDLSENPGYFNTPAVLYADAVIFAAGGAHIELGEHMLGHEYFPNENLMMTEELKQKLLVYYDFLVAYENLLRDNGNFMHAELSTTSPVTISGWPPALGTVSSFKKQMDEVDIFHLINFTGATSLDWRDNEGTQQEPELIENLLLGFESGRQVIKVWITSPDFNLASPSEIAFEQQDQQVLFMVPQLMYWDMIVVEYDSPVFVKQEDNSLPESFILYQNYPNPFNPSTKIKFSIPTSPQFPPYQGGEAKQGWFVQLKVYDVLGNEVAVLINKEMQTGTYEVEFDATNLPSGIYFYQFRAGNFVKTKKMVLLK
jgi:dextranase